MRLVPNQSAEEIARKFEKYVRKVLPKGLGVTTERLVMSEPVLLDRESRFFKAAERAYERVFGKRPVYELSGGSIGVVTEFKEILGLDSILMGYGLPDDNLHGPNEKLSLSMFEKGIKTNMEFLRLVAPH
jgi:acetylornithine deacetylase/succinyl-diaminopimelate desuccinylase-like protein